jgi:hypothetical protein
LNYRRASGFSLIVRWIVRHGNRRWRVHHFARKQGCSRGKWVPGFDGTILRSAALGNPAGLFCAVRDGESKQGWLDPDGSQLRDVDRKVGSFDKHRSPANLAMLDRRSLRRQFQRKKPRGRRMPAHIARGNAARARVRSRVEHVFAAKNAGLV